jgi:hypothetical protein
LRSSSRKEDELTAHDSKTTSRIQNAKAIVEMLAMVGGGVWATYVYLSLNRVANHLAAEQVKHKLEARINVDSRIELRNLGSADPDRFSYDARYGYDVTVTSARKVKIDFVTFEWFLGTWAGTEDKDLFKVNLPTQKEGPFKWSRLGIEAHTAKDYPKENLRTLIGEGLERPKTVIELQDERGVGEYAPEEVIKEYQTIHVEGTHDKWIGFALKIGLEKPGDEPEMYYDEHYVHLAAASPSHGEQGKGPKDR